MLIPSLPPTLESMYLGSLSVRAHRTRSLPALNSIVDDRDKDKDKDKDKGKDKDKDKEEGTISTSNMNGEPSISIPTTATTMDNPPGVCVCGGLRCHHRSRLP
jgi:hypothetical protein